MNKIVYLSGPIRCVSYDDAFKWRNTAREYLASKGFGIKLPERLIDVSPSQIVRNDLRDILHSDIVLAHVPKDVIAIGTTMEIFFASREGKHVILWGGDFHLGISAWHYHHSDAQCETLEEALCLIWNEYSV